MTSRIVLFRNLIEKVNEAAKIQAIDPVRGLLILNESVAIIRQIYDSYETET
jgi:hypothetical protein